VSGWRTPTGARRCQARGCGQAASEDELPLARASRHRGGAGLACQGVRRPELLGMVADLAGVPWRRGDHQGPESSGRSRRQGTLGLAGRQQGDDGRGGVHPAAAHPSAAPRPAAARRSTAAGSRSVGWCRPWPAPAPGEGEVVAASAVATLSANRPGWRCLLAGRPQQVIVARLANQHGGGIALQQPQHGRAPRSSPARVRAAGKLAARSARSRFSSRVWSRAARSSSRAIAPRVCFKSHSHSLMVAMRTVAW
jgi:hypothetical protein